MSEDFSKNEIEFDRRFQPEQACLDDLFELRWPEGFTCPNSGHRQLPHGLVLAAETSKNHLAAFSTPPSDTSETRGLIRKNRWADKAHKLYSPEQ